jgi:hypothetical protein
MEEVPAVRLDWRDPILYQLPVFTSSGFRIPPPPSWSLPLSYPPLPLPPPAPAAHAGGLLLLPFMAAGPRGEDWME